MAGNITLHGAKIYKSSRQAGCSPAISGRMYAQQRKSPLFSGPAGKANPYKEL
jgi:hypothetical protein